MKKLIILSVALSFMVTIGNAQTKEDSLKREIKTLKKEGPAGKSLKKKDRKELKQLEGTETSYQTKQQFAADFGDVPASEWSRTKVYDKATFTKNGKVMSAYYDADAALIGTTTIMTFADLPAIAQKKINTKYKDYQKDDTVLFYDDNEDNETDMVLYGTQFDDADNYFIELQKDNKTIVLRVDPEGGVYYFKQL